MLSSRWLFTNWSISEVPTNIKLQTKLNEPSAAALALPFYNLLPKDRAGLLRWRIYVLKRCLTDTDFRADIRAMCARDVAFFGNTFAWLHETRDDAFTDSAGSFPLILWCDQADLLAWLQQYGGTTDLTIEKTRGIGLSWLVIIYLFWKWLFYGSHLDYGILSKEDKSLDIHRRPATLMGKLDLLFESMPGWLQLGPDSKSILKRTVTKHKFVNTLNNNAILGFTSGDDNLRSARVNLMVVDEAAYLPVDSQRWLASSQFVSSSRIFVSTHDGTATFFYRLTIDEKSRLVRISTWWQDNPARWRGAYIVKAGQVEYLDKEYKHKPDYNFHFEHPGLERSPWVDLEFEKPGADTTKLLQEIYGTAALDTRKLFQRVVIDIAEESCTPPNYRCRLNPHGEFIEDLDGEWFFWQDIALPFDSLYYVGVDPALGVADRALAGIVVIDAKTGHTVVTAGLAETNSVALARAVETLCKKLCGPRGAYNAVVVPESQGIGVSFLTELTRLRWPAIHRENKKLGIPNKDKGEKLLIEAGRAIQDGELVVNDLRIADDFDHFEYDSSPKRNLVFTGDAGHGDIGQATALAWWAARSRRRAVIEAENPTIDPNKQLIENEPLFAERARKSKNWSNRFALN
jgi:hypothetical protein